MKIGTVPYVDTDENTPSNEAGKHRDVLIRRAGNRWQVEIEGVSKGELPLLDSFSLENYPPRRLHRLVKRRKGTMYKRPKPVSFTDRTPGRRIVSRDLLNPPREQRNPRA